MLGNHPTVILWQASDTSNVSCVFSPAGAEKRTLSGMQRRRFQNRVEEDEAEVKRESIDDVLFRELTRREHIATGKYVTITLHTSSGIFYWLKFSDR